MRKISECYRRDAKWPEKSEFDIAKNYMELHFKSGKNISCWRITDFVELCEEEGIRHYYYQRVKQ